jgi:formate hydrogenlyase subunit 3/multisubunit Na+/H+ antiporter MnhD subunit
MMISMFLVLLLRHSLMFLLAWELMSWLPFLPFFTHATAANPQNALYYFVMMHLGAAVLLCGFALLYFQTGSFSFGNLAFGGGVKWLLIIGFAFKAGFFPFIPGCPSTSGGSIPSFGNDERTDDQNRHLWDYHGAVPFSMASL